MANPYSKGQRVEVTSGKEVLHGVVQKADADNVVVRLDSGTVCKPFHHRHFRPSTKPLPEGNVHREWGKGDRVEFPSKDVAGKPCVVHGTVLSVGKSIKVMEDGGRAEFTVPLRLMAPSTKVLPAPVPDAMDAWGVTSYKEARSMSRETVAFTAKVTLDGKVVLFASNDGHGGCNRYDTLPGAPARVRAKFAEAARDWFERHGVDGVREADDQFVTWHATRRPYAMGGAEFIREYDMDTLDIAEGMLARERNEAQLDAEEAAARGPGM